MRDLADLGYKQTAPEPILEEMETLPTPPNCSGEWISGSGGHRTHTPCKSPATWFSYNSMFAYCDDHIREHEKGFPYIRELRKELSWYSELAVLVRKGDAGVGGSALSERGVATALLELVVEVRRLRSELACVQDDLE